MNPGTVTFVPPMVAFDLAGPAGGQDAWVLCQLIDGEIGIIDAGFHFVESRAIEFPKPPKIPGAHVQPLPRRGAQWKSERGLAGRRLGR